MSDIAFGIDLGTSTSEVSYIKDGRPVAINDPHTKSPIVPSVIGLDRKGKFVTGQEALDKALPNAKIRESKRRMGTDERYSLGGHSLLPEDAAALILRKMKDNAEQALGIPMNRAVITVPAYFDDLPRRATERAARLAGTEPIRLISEPVAAAMAYGIERLEEEGRLLVFDFGGGTLDVTIIEMISGVLDVKATDGDKELGGKDMDEALMRFAVERAGFAMPAEGTDEWEALKKEAERTKKDLTAQTTTDIFIPSFQTRNGEVLDLDVEVSRAEFESLIEPFVERALAKIEGSLTKAKIGKERVERLLLVGGTCYIPKVRESVESFFGLKAEPGVDPDLAVSLGAAISAGLKTGAVDARTSVVLQDAATFRLGTRVLERVGEHLMPMFGELMPANASIPWVRKEKYSLLTLEQDEVAVHVLQDRTGRARLADDAIPTGAIGVIKDIPPSTTDEPRAVDIELRFDESQIIRITAKVVGIDREVVIQLNTDQVHPDPLQVLGSANVVDTLWEKSPLAGRNAPLIKRAESVLATKPDNGEHIEMALAYLKAAVASDNPTKTQEARERLTDLLVDAQ